MRLMTHAETAVMVEAVIAGAPGAVERMYAEVAPSIRWYMVNHLARRQNAEDAMQEAFLAIVAAIERGGLADHEKFWGFARTIYGRVCLAEKNPVHAGLSAARLIPCPGPGPELGALHSERTAIMRRLIGEAAPLDREVLTRFYLLGQHPPHICRAMGLTFTQYRILKSRAKARLAIANRGN